MLGFDLAWFRDGVVLVQGWCRDGLGWVLGSNTVGLGWGGFSCGLGWFYTSSEHLQKRQRQKSQPKKAQHKLLVSLTSVAQQPCADCKAATSCPRRPMQSCAAAPHTCAALDSHAAKARVWWSACVGLHAKASGKFMRSLLSAGRRTAGDATLY